MTPTESSAFKYRAFISYRHKDKVWGDWLHKALESYRVPRELVGQPGTDGPIPQRLIPVFRDREDLAASTDLGTEIRQALAGSANLIVICSPGAVASQFVADEIIEFKRLGKTDRIFAIIVEGEPNSPDPALECFPAALKFTLGPDGALSAERTEPIAADAREHADGKENAKLKLIAGVLGVGFDQLRRRELEAQRRRFRRFATIAATLVVVFAGLAGAAGWFGYQSQIERQRAEDNLDRARKTASGVVTDIAGQFRDAAGMQATLGRRILERAKGLMDELGGQGDELAPGRLRERATALGLLGRVSLDLGENDPARATLGESLQIWTSLLAVNPSDTPASVEAARAEQALADAAQDQGRPDEADRLRASARNRLTPIVADAKPGLDGATLAEALELAVNLDPDTQSAARRANLQRLIALRESLGDDGEQRRFLSSDYSAAATIALEGGDLAAARELDAKSITTIEALAASDPFNARWQGDLAAHYLGSAVVAFKTGDVAGTKTRLHQSVEVTRRLIALDPTNARYRTLAANALSLIAALAAMDKDLTGQEEGLSQVVTIWRGLVDIDPRNIEARANLASALGQLGTFYGDAKRPDNQIAALREAVALRKDNVARASLPETNTALAAAMVSLAYALQSKDNTSAEALDLVGQAEAIITPMLAKSPADQDLTQLKTEIETLKQMIAAWKAQAAPSKPPN